MLHSTSTNDEMKQMLDSIDSVRSALAGLKGTKGTNEGEEHNLNQKMQNQKVHNTALCGSYRLAQGAVDYEDYECVVVVEV